MVQPLTPAWGLPPSTAPVSNTGLMPTQGEPVSYRCFDVNVTDKVGHVVLSRGEIIVKDGKFLGKAGRGNFLRRKPRS